MLAVLKAASAFLPKLLTLQESSAITLTTLKKRSDFLRLTAHGMSFATPCFILSALKRDDEASIHIGYTVTKKIGNAVVRNRIKRRLREAVRMMFPAHATAGYDYVLIARAAAETIAFEKLTESLRFALIGVHSARARPPSSRPIHKKSKPRKPASLQ